MTSYDLTMYSDGIISYTGDIMKTPSLSTLDAEVQRFEDQTRQITIRCPQKMLDALDALPGGWSRNTQVLRAVALYLKMGPLEERHGRSA